MMTGHVLPFSSLLVFLGCLSALGEVRQKGRPVPAFPYNMSKKPGFPYNISRNDTGLHDAILTGTYFYNNESNDIFLFKPSAIGGAQRQIIKGIRYLVDLEISRTICTKRQNNRDLSVCAFQPEGRFHQTLQCHFEVWSIPWQHVMKTTSCKCHPMTDNKHHKRPATLV